MGGLIRLTRVVNALSDLATPVVLTCLVPLVYMKRRALAGSFDDGGEGALLVR